MKKKLIPAKEEIKMELAKDSLKHTKNVYETYLEVLIEYNISAIAYSAIKARENYSRELRILMEKFMKKDDGRSLIGLMFGDPNEKKLTELEKIKEEEKYYNELIQLVENRISMFPLDIKMKIAKDAIEKQKAGFGLFKYEKMLKSKKKPKVKASKSFKKPIRRKTSSKKITR